MMRPACTFLCGLPAHFCAACLHIFVRPACTFLCGLPAHFCAACLHIFVRYKFLDGLSSKKGQQVVLLAVHFLLLSAFRS
jgi:hypothetical protein